MSWRYAAAGNGKRTKVPFRRTLLIPPTSPIEVPSIDSQSIDGWGLPEAEQSNHPPDEFENSNREGGSITNAGPRSWSEKPQVFSKRLNSVQSEWWKLSFFKVRNREHFGSVEKSRGKTFDQTLRIKIKTFQVKRTMLTTLHERKGCSSFS